jgi:para-nitrobenzyl esterase
MKRLTAVLLLGMGLALANAYVFPPVGAIRGGVNAQAGVAYFLGIPYASAERWKPPVPIGRFDQVLEATRPTTACPQRGVFTVNYGGYLPPKSEDCLNLAVWMPTRARPAGGWPVIVWIHGGSFAGGSWAEPIYDGTRLAAGGAVVVSINYRLGALGFLALPALKAESSDGSVGNYGLLDQIEALRWVKQNVAAFGGDPANVSLMGQSAGGMAVCTLLAAPGARGLFHKAAVMSGGCEYVRTLEQDAQFLRSWGVLMGCPDLSLPCLRSLPAERFFPTGGEARRQLEALELQAGGFGQLPWKPHVDGVVLSKKPLQALRDGDARNIPLLAGATFQESWDEVGDGPTSWAAFEQQVNEALPGKGAQLAQIYREVTPKPQEAWAYVVTDRVLVCPSLEAAWAQAPFAPSYTYLQTFVTPLWPGLGSFHGIDVPLLFGTQTTWPSLALFFTLGAQEKSERYGQELRQRWLQFAQGGYPGWPEVKPNQLFVFADQASTQPSPYARRCAAFN